MRVQGKRSRSKDKTESRKGFSLIELLIVISVILIIAALAIPNFIQARMRANETAAAQSLRNIGTAEVVYATTYGIGFTDSLAKLGGNGIVVDQNSAGLIDEVLASGKKSGFTYTYKVLTTDPLGHVTNYSINADPMSVGNTGTRHFYTDQTGVIRVNQSSSAGPNDTPI
jgi:type IV pilus assembly protein PilA